jgi:hypothetical protein
MWFSLNNPPYLNKIHNHFMHLRRKGRAITDPSFFHYKPFISTVALLCSNGARGSSSAGNSGAIASRAGFIVNAKKLFYFGKAINPFHLQC